MKTTFCLSIAIAALLIGCSEKSNNTPASTNTTTTSSGNPLTVVPDYAGALATAQKHAVKTIDALRIKENELNHDLHVLLQVLKG